MNMRMMLIGASLFALSTAPSLAEQMRFHAHLTGDQQSPPVQTEAMGSLEAVYDTDTMMLDWTLTYEDLSGAPTAAHYHGPAHPGESAPPVIPIENIESGSEGSAELTEEQANELMNGHYYVNVHTEQHPDGEVRGQVFPAMGMGESE